MTPKRSISSKEGFEKIFTSPDQKFSTRNILVLSKANDENFARIGVAIRKKDIKLAVNRNNIKRKIKGSFLTKALELPSKDFVVLVKRNLVGKEVELKKELENIWGKFKLQNDK